jgi:hypothetical protein
MSDSTAQAIIPALIALVGTILAILVGIWQWRKQPSLQRSSQFVSDKQAAYKALWDKLEEAHVKLRVDNPSPQAHKTLAQDVNSFILKQSLYLEPEDQKLANTYLQRLQDFDKYVQASDNQQVKETWAITSEFPPEMSEAIKTYRDLETTRNQLLERCRKVLSGQGIRV